MFLAALASVVVLAQSPVRDLEERAQQRVAAAFDQVGRGAPSPDRSLAEAARALAARSLESSAAEAAEVHSMTEALSESGSWDPTPRGIFLAGAPASESLRALSQRADLADGPATHVGVGAANLGDRAALVVLLAHRRAALDRFPRQLARPPGPQRLCGALDDDLSRAEVYVTRPDGSVDKVAARSDGEERFCANVVLSAFGRHTLEVLARSTRGPEVVALFFTQVGRPDEPVRHARDEAAGRPELAPGQIEDRVNRLRRSHGLAALDRDRDLDAVAQRYSDRMAKEGFFAHVAPDGSDLRARLVAHGYRYRNAGENLGQSATPMGAHLGIELSPGHRRNLLDPSFTRLGIGLAYRTDGAARRAILTEVFARPAEARLDPIADTYRALHSRRQSLKLPPLLRTPTLDRLAQRHAERALALDRPEAKLDGRSLHDQVFMTLSGARRAAVDFFVVDSADQLAPSKNLADEGNDRIGVGIAQGDSPRYGRNKLWVVVIYASSR